MKNQKGAEETVIVFSAGRSSGYQLSDKDASHFKSGRVSLASLTSDNEEMAINFLPELSKVSEVKLSVDASSSGRNSLHFTEMPYSEGKFYLVDKYLNTRTALKTGFSYDFNIDKSAKGSFGSERFSLEILPEHARINTGLSVDQATSIYPNPATHTLFVNLENKSVSVIAVIYSVSGNLVHKQILEAGRLEIDIQSLPMAEYVLELKDQVSGKLLMKSKFLKH